MIVYCQAFNGSVLKMKFWQTIEKLKYMKRFLR